VILSYRDDLMGDGKWQRIRATITTDHPASSYGQPVIVLADGNGLSWESMMLLQYRVVGQQRVSWSCSAVLSR